jgi:hypothetical protein
MSLERAFSDYIDKFLPEIKKLILHNRFDGDNITFYLKDKAGRTLFVFYYFRNIGYGEDLNCPIEFYEELRAYFDYETDSLLLDWVIKQFDVPLKRVYPTELVKLL